MGMLPKALAEAAEKLDAGLIVVGSRGLTDSASMLLGGVTHTLLRLTGRPVVVARRASGRPSGAARELSRRRFPGER